VKRDALRPGHHFLPRLGGFGAPGEL
jgi:hypothetical protein